VETEFALPFGVIANSRIWPMSLMGQSLPGRSSSKSGNVCCSVERGSKFIDGKLAANYLAFVKLASIRIWLRANKSTPSSVGQPCNQAKPCFSNQASATEQVIEIKQVQKKDRSRAAPIERRYK
jgi:hypothetical protein